MPNGNRQQSSKSSTSSLPCTLPLSIIKVTLTNISPDGLLHPTVIFTTLWKGPLLWGIENRPSFADNISSHFLIHICKKIQLAESRSTLTLVRCFFSMFVSGLTQPVGTLAQTDTSMTLPESKRLFDHLIIWSSEISYNLIILKELNEKKARLYNIFIKNVYIYMFPFFTLPGSRKDRHQDGSSTTKRGSKWLQEKTTKWKSYAEHWALAYTEMREIINWEPILHKEVLKTDIIISFLFHHYNVH